MSEHPGVRMQFEGRSYCDKRQVLAAGFRPISGLTVLAH